MKGLTIGLLLLTTGCDTLVLRTNIGDQALKREEARYGKPSSVGVVQTPGEPEFSQMQVWHYPDRSLVFVKDKYGNWRLQLSTGAATESWRPL